MTTTFCIPNADELGGVNTWALQLAERLGGSSAPHFLLHSPKRSRSRPSLFPAPYLRCFGQLPWGASWWNVRAYAKSYRQKFPTVFIPNWSHGTYAACAELSRAHSSGMRVIGFGHTDQDHYYRHLTYYEPMIHRFVAVSDEIADRLKRYLPHRAEHIEVRPYPIVVPKEFARTYTPPDQPLRLVYAGRFEFHQKRVLDLLGVAQLLVERGVNFRLDLYGEGQHEKPFRKAMARLPEAVRRRLTCHPRVAAEQMSAVWAGADVCLLTSAYEGISISMLEAMAHGCVPVVTRVSGVASVIQTGRNGYFAEVGELYDLVGHLEALALDRALVARMGQSARNSIDDRFCPERYSEWFLDLTKRVWNDEPRAFPPQLNAIPPGAPTLRHRLQFRTKRRLLQIYIKGMELLSLKTSRRNSPLLTSS